MGRLENMAQEGIGFEKNPLYFLVFESNLNSNRI
jgi:hypothetical protein